MLKNHYCNLCQSVLFLSASERKNELTVLWSNQLTYCTLDANLKQQSVFSVSQDTDLRCLVFDKNAPSFLRLIVLLAHVQNESKYSIIIPQQNGNPANLAGFSYPGLKESKNKSLLLFPKEYTFCSRSTNITVKLSTKLT